METLHYTEEEHMVLGSLDDLCGDEFLVDSSTPYCLSAQQPMMTFAPMYPNPESPQPCDVRYGNDYYPNDSSSFVLAPEAPSNFSPVHKAPLKRKRSLSQALAFDEFDLNGPVGASPVSAKKPKTKTIRKRKLSTGSTTSVKSNSSQPAPVESESGRVLTSKYKGVCWYKRTQRWVVQIKVKGTRVHIGYYRDEEKAAESYERAIAKINANPDIDRSELREKDE